MAADSYRLLLPNGRRLLANLLRPIEGDRAFELELDSEIAVGMSCWLERAGDGVLTEVRVERTSEPNESGHRRYVVRPVDGAAGPATADAKSGAARPARRFPFNLWGRT